MDEDVASNDGGGGSAGAPAWVMTFADLMSLLMCFFVLLLSFSEMDAAKYKEVAGSMKWAFGVQRKVVVDDRLKGTSLIAREFTPGKPTPTPMNVIHQQTTNERGVIRDVERTEKDSAKHQAEELKKAFKEEIKKGLLEIERVDNIVAIRIRESGSFASGKAKIQKSFSPVLSKLGKTLNKSDDALLVSGHTDNVPISTAQYASNWMLSSARAANVVQFLHERSGVEAGRLEIRAHADTVPLAANDTTEGRAKNRRVEILVVHKESPEGENAKEAAPIPALVESNKVAEKDVDASSPQEPKGALQAASMQGSTDQPTRATEKGDAQGSVEPGGGPPETPREQVSEQAPARPSGEG